MENKTYDIIGIGIGPFNLGLAALAAEIDDLDCIFIDGKQEFNWHPGMMLPAAKMQLPFLADLVTLANPRSAFTYLQYLKDTGRLFKFVISENHIPYRREFNDYCKWVINKLNSVRFGQNCTSIDYNKKRKTYIVRTENTSGTEELLYARNVVIGIGSAPYVPACAISIKHPLLFHSSDYLSRKDAALMNKSISIIGSGQSAAEIFLDLLPHMQNLRSLNWYTRSARFHPMEYSKFTLEMSSPEYINYFYSLSDETKSAIVNKQQYLFRGINSELIDEIYKHLYLMDMAKKANLPHIRTNCEVKNIRLIDKRKFSLYFEHTETARQFSENSEVIILATGYEYKMPSFLHPLSNLILWRDDRRYHVQKNYAINQDNTLFVQNAELHTHGFNSADLGLGAYRNALILNTILRREYFKIEPTGNVFQQFAP